MSSDLHEMHFRHLCEIADLRRELDEVRAAYADLRAATLTRRRAELACLTANARIARARAAERDPAIPLQ